MCQIAVNINTQNVKSTVLTGGTVVRKIMQPFNTFGHSNLTTDEMFSGQHFVIFAMFLLRACVIICVNRLRDFVCEEVA